MLAATLCATIALTQLSGADHELLEVIQDAQATNLAKFPRGVMTLEVTSAIDVPGRSAREGHFRGEVQWDGPNSLLVFEAADPNSVLRIAGVNDSVRNSKAEPLTVACLPGKIFLYASSVKRLQSFPRDPASERAFVSLQLAPPAFWTRFHDASPNASRPWSEMFGIHADFREIAAKVALLRVDETTYRQVRDDKGGGRLEIDVSMARGGNVVSCRYSMGRVMVNENTYEWTPYVIAGSHAFFLTKCKLVRDWGDGKQTYNYSVLDFDPARRPTPTLTESAFFARLPRGAVVRGEGAGPGSGAKGRAPLDDEQIDRLSRKLKARGFMSEPAK